LWLRWLWGLSGLVTTIGRSERQTRGIPHQLALLIREHSFEPIRIDDLLALIGRHGAEVINRGMDHPPPIGWKLPHLPEDLPCLLLLLGSQMFPGLHAVEDL
jgi:hypothetical protein